MRTPFADFDFTQFWQDSEYAIQEYIESPLTDGAVGDVEFKLGYTLPKSYVELMRFQNGGIPRRTCHHTSEPTSWSHDHIAIHGIFSIGEQKHHSLLGRLGSQHWIDEWGYPPICVYFADCPSAGHDMICLDYRACGPRGEPQVVHIDQEQDYKIVFVTDTFEAFIRGLQDSSVFESEM